MNSFFDILLLLPVDEMYKKSKLSVVACGSASALSLYSLAPQLKNAYFEPERRVRFIPLPTLWTVISVPKRVVHGKKMHKVKLSAHIKDMSFIYNGFSLFRQMKIHRAVHSKTTNPEIRLSV